MRVLRTCFNWPCWGVLVTGTLSSLAWVRGPYVFRGHLWPTLAGIIVLPVVGGFLTPEKPAYTVIVFASTSCVPLNDIPPIPVAWWPLLYLCLILARALHPSDWRQLSADLGGLAEGMVACCAMAVLYAPLVYLGWAIRRRFKR